MEVKSMPFFLALVLILANCVNIFNGGVGQVEGSIIGGTACFMACYATYATCVAACGPAAPACIVPCTTAYTMCQALCSAVVAIPVP